MTLIALPVGFASGVSLGLASIVSIGPNNIVMIREGLKRGHVRLVGTTIWSSYMVLLVAAYAFAGSTVLAGPVFRTCLSGLGIVAILFCAASAFRAAMRSKGGVGDDVAGVETKAACLRRIVLVVFLNPLTYVELLLIPSSVAANYPGSARIEFVAGLVAMATLACCGYPAAARRLAAIVGHPRAIPVFDTVSGVLLTGVAIAVGVGLVTATR